MGLLRKVNLCSRNKKKLFFVLIFMGIIAVVIINFINNVYQQNALIFVKHAPSVFKNRRKIMAKSPSLLFWMKDFNINKTKSLKHAEVVDYNGKINKGLPLQFNINDADVIVFVHIQKTGGSNLNRHLIFDLTIGQCASRSKKRKFRVCLRPNDNSEWLFTRLSTKYSSPCGLHADWTTLQNCVPRYFNSFYNGSRKHRYFYMTVLRDPVARYLSEWGHTFRGATWNGSFTMCQNKLYEHISCWKKGKSWQGVSLDEFLSCPNNWADNRMTWMLADLNLINCTGETVDRKGINRILLNSAKHNLERMFFGIMKRQSETQFLFESFFNLTFNTRFAYVNDTLTSKYKITKQQIKLIKKKNSLDLQLYDFALKLFEKRYTDMKRQVV